jgi:Leucine-rich repeat (LRR) protein
MKLKKLTAVLLTGVFVLTGAPLNMGQPFMQVEASTVVNIPDPYLKAAINKELGVTDSTADITVEQMAQVKKLYLSSGNYSNTTDLTGVEYLTNCTYLDASECRGVTDITPIGKMPNLTSLNLEKIAVTEENEQAYMETLSKLKGLQSLNVAFCQFPNDQTKVFDNLPNLKRLCIGCNYEIDDISFLLKHKDKLEELALYSTNLDNGDTAVLRQLTNLNTLQFSSTAITDYRFLNYLPKLTSFSYRWAAGTTSFPASNSVDKEADQLFILSGSDSEKTLTYQSPYIGTDGKYIAPMESTEYEFSFNQSTGIVTIKLQENVNSYTLKYSFNQTVPSGTTFVFKTYAYVDVDCINADNVYRSHPQYTSQKVGGSLTMTARLNSKVTKYNPTYQWYKEGVAIPGATSSTYEVDKVKISDVGTYYLITTVAGQQFKSNDANINIYGFPWVEFTEMDAPYYMSDVTIKNMKEFTLYDGNYQKKSENKALATGDIIVVKDSSGVETEYVVSIMGDVNKDSKIDVLDMEQIQKHILKIQLLDTFSTRAAKIENGMSISALDMELIQKEILGL